MKIISLAEIKDILKSIDLMPLIEEGFAAYSQGCAVVPPVGELIFAKQPGEVHIKYGYIKDDDYYVIKIASGFYENPQFNLPSSNGLMLVFSQKTGQPLGILLDEGYLTNVRTAIAGAIAAKYLAPKNIHAIGIVGTGTQAQMQLMYLKQVTHCKDVIVWGRNPVNLENYVKQFATEDFNIITTTNITELTNRCNLIVTTTPAKQPLLYANNIQPGTHITAMGADTADKQELDAEILQRADIIVADSIVQCRERGEISHANKLINSKIIELGHIIANKTSPRQSESQITIADLTGVAVQDIQIAKAVYAAAH